MICLSRPYHLKFFKGCLPQVLTSIGAFRTLPNICGGCSLQNHSLNIAQKMKFFVRDFLSKCGQIRNFLRIWSHFLKKSLIENFIFCAVKYFRNKLLHRRFTNSQIQFCEGGLYGCLRRSKIHLFTNIILGMSSTIGLSEMI